MQNVNDSSVLKVVAVVVFGRASGLVGPGVPKTASDIQQLVIRMARDNPRWGYSRIRNALHDLGHEIGRNTIKQSLLENGFDPFPFSIFIRGF